MFRRKPQHRPAPPARLGRGKRLGGINLLAGIIKRLCPTARHFQRVNDRTSPALHQRWTARRKAAVVQSVRLGLISLEEACLRYDLTVEELFGWQRAVDRHGIPGLRVTRLQIYRDTEELRSTKGANDDSR